MADTKITALDAIGANPINVATFPIPMVDLLDNSMAASGTTKKVTVNQILGAGGTATLASATITGDLTVDTSTLKVDSTNNRVTVGTTSAYGRLTVGVGSGLQAGTTTNVASGLYDIDYATTGDINTRFSFVNSNGVTNAAIDRIGNPNVTDSGNLAFLTRSGAGSLTERYRIASDGVATWSNVGGVAGTAMTLNSTGLGVGASPSYKLSVAGTANIGTIGTAGRSLLIASSAADNITIEQTNNGSGSHTFDIKTPGWSTDSFNVYSGSTNRLKLTGDGNLGIGVTPSAWNTFKAIQHPALSLASYSTTEAYYSQNAYNDGTWRRVAAGYASQYIQVNSEHRFLTAGTDPTVDSAITFTQAMTLDASGNLLVGKTASSTTVAGSQVQPDGTHSAVKSDGNPGFFYNTTTAISGTIALFRSNGVTVGSISQDGTNTAYNNSSDYRLKESVQPLTGGLDRVNALKPSIYKWKTNGKVGEGFLAHELAEVVPFAVTGEKDAVTKDGEIEPQQVDLSKVVPILVAAIKELTAEVNALKNA
jgi:hypothetical protein